MGRFSFTGKVRINGQDSKFPAYRSGETKKGDKYHSLTFFVNSDDNNSGTVELFGMKSDTIRTTTNEGETEIDWDDRKDAKVVESVVGYRKNVIQLEEGNENRQTFISPYDAVAFIWDNIDDLKGKLVTVTGRVTKNEYNGKISDRFQIQNVYAAKDDKKPGLTLKEEIFFNKDSFDFSEFKETKRIYVNAYTQEYIDNDHKSVYVPKMFVIDCHKIDFDDEKMIKLFNGRWMPLMLKYEKGKPSVDLKSSKYYKMMVDVNYRNGASEEEFSEDMLTDLQRTQLELGLKTLDDFRPNGRTFGNRVVEYRLVNCDIRGEYDNGVVALDDTVEEFEGMIYQVVEDDDDGSNLDMNVPEEKKKATSKKEEKTKMRKIDSDAMNQTSVATKVIARLNGDPTFNLAGQINPNDGIINSPIMFVCINTLFCNNRLKKKDELQVVIETTNKLKEVINYITEKDKKYLNRWDRQRIIAVAYACYKQIPLKKILKEIQAYYEILCEHNDLLKITKRSKYTKLDFDRLGTYRAERG